MALSANDIVYITDAMRREFKTDVESCTSYVAVAELISNRCGTPINRHEAKELIQACNLQIDRNSHSLNGEKQGKKRRSLTNAFLASSKLFAECVTNLHKQQKLTDKQVEQLQRIINATAWIDDEH